MNARSPYRFRLAVLLAASGALALGSFWVLEVMKRATDQDAPVASRSEPDYYVENFNFVRMSKTGEARYNISGRKLTHYPANDTHMIEQPVVNSLSSKRPPMKGIADRAVVDNTSSKVHLYDNVHLDRPATATDKHFHLTSDYLLLLPDEDVVETHLPAVITMGDSRLSGVGMWANNATRELRLGGNVHATYQPPAQAAPR
jgi:lipopolysaccharide export system protein LptC